MECSRCELCAAAGEVFLPSSFSYFALLFRIVSGPLLIVITSLLALAVFRSKSLPSNAKILLFLFCIAMLLSNIGIFAGAQINLIVSFVLPEERRCEYQVFSPYLHKAYHILSEIGLFGMIFSFLTLSAERTISFLSGSKYPKRLLLPVFCFVQGLLVLLLLFFTNSDPAQILPYQALELRNTGKYQEILDISTALSVFEIAVFVIILRPSQQRKAPRPNSTASPGQCSIFVDRMLLHISALSFFFFLTMQLISRSSMPNIGPETAITSELLAQVVSYSPFGEVRKCILPVATMLISVTFLTKSEEIRKVFLGLLPNDILTRHNGGENKQTTY